MNKITKIKSIFKLKDIENNSKVLKLNYFYALSRVQWLFNYFQAPKILSVEDLVVGYFPKKAMLNIDWVIINLNLLVSVSMYE